MKKFEWYEFIDLDLSQMIGEKKRYRYFCEVCKVERSGKYCIECGTKLTTLEIGEGILELNDVVDIDDIGLDWCANANNFTLKDSPNFKIDIIDIPFINEKVVKRFNTKKWKDVFKVLDSHKAVYKKKYFVSYDGEI